MNNAAMGKLALELSKKLLVALATGAASMAVSGVMNKLLDGGFGAQKTITTTATPVAEPAATETTNVEEA